MIQNEIWRQKKEITKHQSLTKRQQIHMLNQRIHDYTETIATGSLKMLEAVELKIRVADGNQRELE